MSQAYIFSSVSHLGQIYTCINKERALWMSIKGLDTKYSIIMYLYNFHYPLKNYYWYSVVTLTLQSQIFWCIFFSFIGKLQGYKKLKIKCSITINIYWTMNEKFKHCVNTVFELNIYLLVSRRYPSHTLPPPPPPSLPMEDHCKLWWRGGSENPNRKVSS